MADVSHELGALRYVVDASLSSKVAMFNKQTQQHQQNQLLNPFSGTNGRVSPKPTFSKDEYGKPLAGSLTEMRGQKANMHVLREMLELCQIISSEGYSVKDEPNMRVIPFGELFNIYNYISDKVVGILLRARKHKLVEFEGEMLFQRRDDDVPVFLLRPVAEIRRELQGKIDEIKRASSPAPQATTLMLDKGAHEQKLQEAGLSAPKRKSQSRTPSPSPANSKAASPANSKAASPAPADKVAAVAAQQQRPPVPPRPTVAPAALIKPVAVVATVNSEEVQQTVAVAAAAEVAVAEESATTAEATETAAASQPAESGEAAPQSTESAVAATAATNAVAAPTIEIQSAANDDNNSTNNNNNNLTDVPTIIIEASAVYTSSAVAPAVASEQPAAAAEAAAPTEVSTAAVPEVTAETPSVVSAENVV